MAIVRGSWAARFWWCAPDKRKMPPKRKWHEREVRPVIKYHTWLERAGGRKMVVVCKPKA